MRLCSRECSVGGQIYFGLNSANCQAEWQNLAKCFYAILCISESPGVQAKLLGNYNNEKSIPKW
jgi:hypothetical protein